MTTKIFARQIFETIFGKGGGSMEEIETFCPRKCITNTSSTVYQVIFSPSACTNSNRLSVLRSPSLVFLIVSFWSSLQFILVTCLVTLMILFLVTIQISILKKKSWWHAWSMFSGVPTVTWFNEYWCLIASFLSVCFQMPQRILGSILSKILWNILRKNVINAIFSCLFLTL